MNRLNLKIVKYKPTANEKKLFQNAKSESKGQENILNSELNLLLLKNKITQAAFDHFTGKSSSQVAEATAVAPTKAALAKVSLATKLFEPLSNWYDNIGNKSDEKIRKLATEKFGHLPRAERMAKTIRAYNIGLFKKTSAILGSILAVVAAAVYFSGAKPDQGKKDIHQKSGITYYKEAQIIDEPQEEREVLIKPKEAVVSEKTAQAAKNPPVAIKKNPSGNAKKPAEAKKQEKDEFKLPGVSEMLNTKTKAPDVVVKKEEPKKVPIPERKRRHNDIDNLDKSKQAVEDK